MGTAAALLGLLFLTACGTTAVVTPAAVVPPSDDDDFSQLVAQMRSDLNYSRARQVSRPKQPASASASQRNSDFAERARALFAPLSGTAMKMPVVGITPTGISDSWGDPRDGGRRKHRGIDIFAPKGTPVIAVVDGFISYIGVQPKGGQVIWLTTDAGTAFYYAHLDRWAPGLYEGMEVRSGEILGYVGNTGNARTTPPHLHFGINENDEMVNPYPILRKASVVRRASLTSEAGASMGTR
jgi:murein DD-endopeptidase MepM/ murein hydrolase activator NlpD